MYYSEDSLVPDFPCFSSSEEFEEYIHSPPLLHMHTDQLLPSLCQSSGDVAPQDMDISPSSSPSAELATEEYIWKRPSHNSNEFRGNALALINAHFLQIPLQQFKIEINCPRKQICTKGYGNEYDLMHELMIYCSLIAFCWKYGDPLRMLCLNKKFKGLGSRSQCRCNCVLPDNSEFFPPNNFLVLRHCVAVCK